MISVSSIYLAAISDDVNTSENGGITLPQFGRYLRRAEINLLKYLTGDLMPRNDFPMPFNTQKNKDYLKRFITKKKANGAFILPEDYYMYDNLYKIGSKKNGCEDEGELADKGCNIPIPILDGQKFYSRCNSYIKGLKPTANNPICKIVNNSVEFQPEDVGSVVLEYIRYPKFADVVTKEDKEFNDVVIDESKSTNLEWDEWAFEPLVWFIVNRAAVHTRERSAMENNLANKPQG